jgi:23S rRNA (adenine2030-N6)-methyltransferase
MNYRHAFHAGNHADVLKHMALVFCLDAFKRKDTPFAVLDTHAGPGLYDLASDEARRSPEWKDGIRRLWDWVDAPAAIGAYLARLAPFNPDGQLRFYPGSPALIAAALRPSDVLTACELHPEDARVLRRRFADAPQVRVHERDGWQALSALLPPEQRRGLVLIDPPYEAPDELAQAAQALGPALARFGHGCFLWWRPLKSDSALDQADGEARAQGAKEMLRVDFWVDTPAPTGKLVGSSLLLINPPFGLEAALRDALPALAKRLAIGEAGWKIGSV